MSDIEHDDDELTDEAKAQIDALVAEYGRDWMLKAVAYLARHEQAIRREHSIRFRKVAHRYPRAVATAFDGDLYAARRASDDEVAERVRAWEVAEGIEPRDWQAIGAAERDEDV